MCKYLYENECNITGVTCWYLVSGVEQITCVNYEKDEYKEKSDQKGGDQ